MPANPVNPKLFVKSYFAATIEQAMEAARAELGPEVLLLNTREAPAEARHLGECEVVFGIGPAAKASTPAPAAVDPLGDLRNQMEEIRELVCRIGADNGGRVIEAALFEAGVPRRLAGDVENAVRQRIRGRNIQAIGRSTGSLGCTPEELVLETNAELENRVQIAAETGRVTALIGPPGSGKTTCLVKLAVQSMVANRPVQLISIDNYRIAAAEQLRTYANILGVSFTFVETPAALAQAIDLAPPEAQIFIDTPGWSGVALQENGVELAAFLEHRQEIDAHLVLTAAMRPSDMQRMATQFQMFVPQRLLFTHLDETDSTAAMFSLAAISGLPVSFLSMGQVIPEDLAPATKARLVSGLVRELPKLAQAVA